MLEDRGNQVFGTLRERHRLPLVWIVPIVAILAAGWLAWRTLSERGPVMFLTMQTADGIEPGKTQVRHNQIELGIVEALEPSANLSRVTLRIRMNRYADGHLNSGTRFWVVRPRFSLQGISGLGTLISGSYIEMEPGTGTPANQFEALAEPPVITSDVPGTAFILHATRLGSISIGAPVSYHGLEVGQVLGTTLSDTDGTATVRIFVRAPHDRLVHDGTRFWNSSGLAVKLGSEGLRVRTESLEAILAGGVAFDVPRGGTSGPLADSLASFDLFGDEDAAHDALFIRHVPFLLHLSGSAAGLSVGADVQMRGVRVGEVTDLHMEYDAANNRITIPVTIQVEPQRVAILHRLASNSDFRQRSYDTFRMFVANGLRARLKSGSLLTGQQVVSLEFMPQAPASSMIETGSIPEIPFVGADDLSAVIQSARGLLDHADSTVVTLNGLIASPEVRRSLGSLDASLGNLSHLTHEANLQAGPLLIGLRSVSHSADETLRQATAILALTDTALGVGGSSGNLAATLIELKQAARSLRDLADYLEAHPGSLLRGKSGSATR